MEKQKAKIRVKRLYEKSSPIIPAVGDIRLSYSYSSGSKPKLVFHVLKCISIDDGFATYQYMNETDQDGNQIGISIPFEIVTDFGFTSTNKMIKSFMNKCLKDVIVSSENSVENLFDANSDIEEYSKKLENIVILYRMALKEADRINKIIF